MKKCKTCKYHDLFSWACCNGISTKVADFTDNDDYCDEWDSEYDRCREDVGNNDDDGQGSK